MKFSRKTLQKKSTKEQLEGGRDEKRKGVGEKNFNMKVI